MTDSTSDNKSDYDAPLIAANASLFRHSAKISYLSMVSLIMGFAHGASITDAARTAEVHRDTARDIFAALRDRLANPRFKKWVQSAYASPYLRDEDDAAQMEEVRAALFKCHDNTGCQKRYAVGRRQSRVCQTCPIKIYVAQHDAEPDYAPALVELVDNLRQFYQLLGWKESINSGSDKRVIFDKRFLHYEVYSMAVGNSTFDENGKVTSDEDDFLGIHHLSKELMDDLKDEPLK